MIVKERLTGPTQYSARGTSGGLAILGMSGAGKTTLAALLALCATDDGEQVLAVDADPTAALAYGLGVPIERARAFVPLIRNIAYIEEKTGGTKTEEGRQVSSRVPDVGDLFERFAIPVRDGLRLLVMGGMETFVSGCRCPEHVLSSAILQYLARQNREVLIMDTGGLYPPEELSGSLFQHALVVAEPMFHSLRIAEQLTSTLLERGIPHLHLVVNKMRKEEDVRKVKQFTTGLTCYEHVFSLPFEEELHKADPDVSALLPGKNELVKKVRSISQVLRETPGA
jgi:CO dehydrogenase maturation factor